MIYGSFGNHQVHDLHTIYKLDVIRFKLISVMIITVIQHVQKQNFPVQNLVAHHIWNNLGDALKVSNCEFHKPQGEAAVIHQIIHSTKFQWSQRHN